MSPKTVITREIHKKNKKNHRIDQNTWLVPNSAAIVTSSSDVIAAALGLDCSR